MNLIHRHPNLLIPILIFCYLVCLSTVAEAQETETELVDRAIVLFSSSNFDEAELVALRALVNQDRLAPVDKERLHRILGFIYVVQEKNQKAIQQFINWLELDPLVELDPVYISPKIIAVFEDAKRQYELQQKLKTPVDYTSLNQQVNAFKRSLFFPGIGQLYQGKQVKGYSLFAAEILLLGTFAYCQVNYIRTRDDYLAETDVTHMQSLYDEYNLFYRGRYASLFLAAGVYVYSLFDVLYFPPAIEDEPIALTFSVSPHPLRLVTFNINLP